MARSAATNSVQIRNQAGSLLFTGASANYVDLPMNFNPSTGDFAITMWVRPTRMARNDTLVSHAYYSGGDGAGTGRTWMSINAIGVQANNEFESFFGGVDNLSTYVMDRAVWQHLGISYNQGANTVSYYVNGTAYGTTTPTVESATGTQRIGASKSGAANARAYIGITKVFRRQLTGAEFLSDYVSGVISNTSNLQAVYNFSNGSGTTLTDSSGNSNNGTIVGSDVTWSTVAAVKSRSAASARTAASGRTTT